MYYTKTLMEHLHININIFLCCHIFSSFVLLFIDVVQLPVLSEQAVCLSTFKLFHFILIRSNKMQQYAGIYLLQNHSTCFVCPSHPSSGVHKTNCSLWYSNNLPPTWPDLAMLEEGCCSDTMTCTRGCSYSFIHSLMMGVMDTRNM